MTEILYDPFTFYVIKLFQFFSDILTYSMYGPGALGIPDSTFSVSQCLSVTLHDF